LTIYSAAGGIEFFLAMARYNELPVYKASYDLLLEIFRLRFVLVNKQVENVSRQLTGWQKKFK